ncbi:uncharacterized protein YecA (UPF0149 family) [Streptococcus rupicaprae]|uniref:Uncharacterized protein YecA (UPF0149 family) n=1 Tax=Streptococcus rupicaprae TaxID=759619 RepID=A0ABV2FH62_9STRE
MTHARTREDNLREEQELTTSLDEVERQRKRLQVFENEVLAFRSGSLYHLNQIADYSLSQSDQLLLEDIIADTQSLSQRLQVKIDNRLEVLRKKAYHLEEQIDGLRQERLVMSQVETETKVERKENKHG